MEIILYFQTRGSNRIGSSQRLSTFIPQDDISFKMDSAQRVATGARGTEIIVLKKANVAISQFFVV